MASPFASLTLCFARYRSVPTLAIALAVLTCPAWQRAEAATPGALELLEIHCVQCHGGASTKGGLDLVTREGLLRGGESGETVVSGDPDASLLLQTIRHQHDPHMPYKEAKLPDAVISQLADWVKAGVPYSRALNRMSGARKTDSGFTLTDADRSHWAFQPVRAARPPSTRQSGSRSENPIDQFILEQLATNGLSFAPPATRTTLIRRVTLDLIGLPPTPAEIDAFLNDDSPCAYENLVDRLLASPNYGERWGRHWLDLARYAETDGFEHDAVRPHSWRYRDYVIQSFNDDKPYDRFIREQLAGDELWPDEPDAITATGFHLLGPDMVDSSDQIQRRYNTLNDMTDTTALAFLGLTLGCARCHDHKFEPISQRDYYRLQAFFTPATFDREKAIPTTAILAAHEAAIREFNEHPKLRELAAIETPVRKKLLDQKVARLSAEAQVAHRTPPEQRNAEQANIVLETAVQVQISDKEIASALSDDEKPAHARLQEEVKKLPRPNLLPKTMALGSGNTNAKTFMLYRGEYNQPGDEVTAGFPGVITAGSSLDREGSTIVAAGESGAAFEAVGSSSLTSGRAVLANWIASPENPLTARVMVNRIWQHHFGRGLVPTPSDFGTHGHPPTHPALLDWLANEFSEYGWSVKQMHRRMLISATYRQTSVFGKSPTNPNREDRTAPEAANSSPASDGELPKDAGLAWKRAVRTDPDNRLYWRMNRLRLEGEVIRDGLLAISGQLNQAMGGPGVFPPIPKELFAGAKGWSTGGSVSEHSRRSVYIFARRNLRFPFLEVFDAPDSNLSCPLRDGSTTAPQSLTLLNANEVTTASKATANDLKRNGQSVEQEITLAYRLVLGRTPTERERALALEFLTESPLDEFCRALFNLNEFIYVE